MSAADGMDAAHIDRALGSRILLRFPPALESTFEAETGGARCRWLVFAGIAALVIYNSFLLADTLLVPDIMPVVIALRLGVVTPIAVIMLMVLWRQPPPWLRETIAAFAPIIAAASTLALMLVSAAPYRIGQHHTIILVILFATMVQRLRFAYAVVSCCTCLALHVAALALVPNYPDQLWISGNMILSGAVVLALLAAYALERETRRTYLDARRERMLNRELAVLSRHDPLTGLGNRRALDEILGDMEMSATGDTELAVLLFDIDHFKAFNDTVGHPAGDVCLKRIAGLMRGELRERGDLAFRFGGEEFLVALPRTGLPSAIAIAERVRRTIEEAAIPHPALASGGSVVTVSVGAACAMLGEGMRAVEIIASADAALYAAKRNGRNQVWPPFLNARRPEVVDLAGRKAASK